MKRSITIRLVVMFCITSCMIFGAIDGALYEVLRHELRQRQQDALDTVVRDLNFMMGNAGSVERWLRVQAKLASLTPEDGSLRFWVYSGDKRFIFARPDEHVDHTEATDTPGVRNIYVTDREYPFRSVVHIVPAFQDRPALQLIVGIDTGPYRHTLHNFLMALIGLSLVGVTLITLFGRLIVKTGLRPLREMSERASQLGPLQPLQRLDLSRLPNELSELALAFNGALDRMHGAYGQLEAFNADVAHELRTPLTNLIGGTQVALSRERTALEFQNVLESNLEELDRLRSIVNDMLFLARSDQGQSAPSRGSVILAEEVEKTIEFVEFILDDAGMTVSLQGELGLEAPIDKSLFRRALTNLLHNAIQHSQEGDCIVVNLARRGPDVSIQVANPGAPIATPHLERLFDRFYRIDAARSDDQSIHGHGLGLAIVKAVARMHGGSAFALSEKGFNIFGFTVTQI